MWDGWLIYWFVFVWFGVLEMCLCGCVVYYMDMFLDVMLFVVMVGNWGWVDWYVIFCVIYSWMVLYCICDVLCGFVMLCDMCFWCLCVLVLIYDLLCLYWLWCGWRYWKVCSMVVLILLVVCFVCFFLCVWLVGCDFVVCEKFWLYEMEWMYGFLRWYFIWWYYVWGDLLLVDWYVWLLV